MLNVSQTELTFLRSLNKRQARFLIVGMSAAALQGSMLLTEDVDLWIENLRSEAFLAAVADADG